ncbi:amidohydrolase family protein [Pelomonas sp. SE-A7]|uniref:amidohydrolase family protein n=1 Tax=Pelomonas sp. SE-A7 TaxID=3054953 RepID=UPI00259CADC2|nr:amidohydrolase family protein [Pelomonas sp. SE-A7]MDM4764920.1 amidohydrolase family protein [Pelomonas sp. SE-A7]
MKTITMKRHLLATALLALTASVAQANPNVPPPAQSKPLLITNATLNTVSGPVVSNGRMLVEGGRIKAIGGAELQAPAGAQVIDLQGRQVYPGMVSANTVMGLVEVSAVRATVDTAETGAVNPNARALVAINADSDIIPVTRASGVLTVLSVPQPRAGIGLVAGTSALVQLDGWNWEDMALRPEVGLHVTLPTMRSANSLFATGTDSPRDELRRTVNAKLKQLDEVFEMAAAYAKAKAADPKTALDTRWEAMLPVVRGERPVFVDADDRWQIRQALDLAERFKLKLAIVGGADSAALAGELKARDVAVVIGSVNRLPLRRDDDVDAIYRLPGELARAGVRFCIAREDRDPSNERNLGFEAGQAVAHGLNADEALKAITLYPARILGAEKELGSLEVGKYATFFVADGSPLDIRSAVQRIFIQGREIELKDKQTGLRDKYQQRYHAH